jgi:hypothetical protein
MDGQEEVEQGADQQTENPTDKPKEEAVEEKRKKKNGLVKQGSSEQRKRTDKAQEKEAAVSVRVLHIYMHAAVSVRVLLHIYIAGTTVSPSDAVGSGICRCLWCAVMQ